MKELPNFEGWTTSTVIPSSFALFIEAARNLPLEKQELDGSSLDMMRELLKPDRC
ncbi:hypothetical protein Syun_017341 [Stephania yunnanensis]|uniref:Uncharacterized protein n=1 Tax=Stephania yunnanensis TaxID=152371 RepID=A0AAP0P3A1_9MAGN